MLHNLKIRNKIVLFYIPQILIPLLILGVVANSTANDAIIGKAIHSVSDQSALITTRIESIMQNAEGCADILALSMNHQLDLQQLKSSDSITQLQLFNQINTIMKVALFAFPDVDSIYFIDRKERVFSSAITDKYDRFPGQSTPMFQAIGQSNGVNLWFPMERRDYLVTDDQVPVVSIGKKLFDMNTGEFMGYLVLNVKESAISNIFRGLHVAESKSGISIVNDQGIVVSSPRSNELFRTIEDPALLEYLRTHRNETDFSKASGTEWLISTRELAAVDWLLVNQVSVRELTTDNRKITTALWVIGAVCLFIGGLSTLGFSGLLTRPIIALTKQVSRVKVGNFSIKTPVQSKDEIGLLTHGFNSMVEKIDSLFEHVKTEQRRKREIELALLQAQIKPHFLYNTLETIYSLSAIGREEDARQTTKSLANFYRGTLSGGEEEITIGQEIRMLSAYLFIQHIRYSDRFDYTIHIPKELESYPILKLTVQPIVENSIYHGLKKRATKGLLSIHAIEDRDMVTIAVEDNGAGMTEAAAKASLLPGKKGIHYGLSSVDQRLKLYYGEQSGLILRSRLGMGTTVLIRIPKHAGKESVDVFLHDRG